MRRIDDYMGYLYAAASSLSMALMLLSAKVIAQGLGSFLGAFVRGISMFLINYILMKRDSVNYYAHSSEGIQPFIVVEKLLLKRAIFGGLTMVFYLGPIAYISTSAANSLLNLGPIIVHFMEVHTLKVTSSNAEAHSPIPFGPHHPFVRGGSPHHKARLHLRRWLTGIAAAVPPYRCRLCLLPRPDLHP